MATALVIGDCASTAVRSAIRAAQACVASGKIDVLLVGKDVHKAGEEASKWMGVTRVFVGEHETPATAEVAASTAVATLQGGKYGFVVAAADTFGKNVVPRMAGVLGLAAVSDVVEVRDAKDGVFVRPMYAGNALATVRNRESLKLLTVRTTAFAPVTARSDGLAEVLPATDTAVDDRSRWTGAELAARERPELTGAGVVVAGGRGLKSGENFKLLEEMADELGGAVGATRAAVDLGWVPNDMQIGQTGKVVAPDLYVAVGLSGAIQHLAGMKESKTIVAINKDASAPIFQIADYGLVTDLFVAMPQLVDKIKALPKKETS